MAKVTSEDKLLAVIENHAASEKKGAPSQQKKSGGPALKEKFALLLKPRTLNRILVGLCVAVTFYFVFDFYYRNTKLKNLFIEIKQGKGQRAAEQESLPVLDVNFMESLELAEGRNIFSLSPPEKEIPAPTRAGIDVSVLLENLKVVAIIWAGENSQVMMEDLKKKKSYSLVEGDVINKFEVKRINKSSVILERDGKEWMIR